MASQSQRLPEGLPAPVDDGACDHLPGLEVPDIALPSTAGGQVRLAEPAAPRTVVFAYPRTGRPGEELPGGKDAWYAIPGAAGCTPQACAYRDATARFREHGVRLYGLSTQDTAYQREMATRLGLPYEVLSDAGLRFASALRLPTFEVQGATLLRRHTLVIDRGVIEHVFYPVFPPDRDATQVLAWLEAHPAGAGRH
jgi:peroxiredoxin